MVARSVAPGKIWSFDDEARRSADFQRVISFAFLSIAAWISGCCMSVFSRDTSRAMKELKTSAPRMYPPDANIADLSTVDDAVMTTMAPSTREAKNPVRQARWNTKAPASTLLMMLCFFVSVREFGSKFGCRGRVPCENCHSTSMQMP